MAVRKTKEGANLKRWFKEKWVDVRTGKPCGRTKGVKRGTPYCRPSKRISSKTVKTASEMSPSEKAKKIQAPTPLAREKSGIPNSVKVLKRVAAKVIKPITTPIFAPPNIKSDEVLICFFVRHEKNIKIPIYRVPIIKR